MAADFTGFYPLMTDLSPLEAKNQRKRRQSCYLIKQNTRKIAGMNNVTANFYP